MKKHYCLVDKGWISYEGTCNWCGEKETGGQIVKDDLVYRLRKRAEIRRQIDTRKSVQNNEPDRIADLLEEASEEIEHLEKVKDLHRDAHHKCVELSRDEYKKVLETMEKYKKVLEEIANDYPELSYDKARMQNLDHIKWAKEVLK